MAEGEKGLGGGAGGNDGPFVAGSWGKKVPESSVASYGSGFRSGWAAAPWGALD